jgi:hypothetical protein
MAKRTLLNRKHKEIKINKTKFNNFLFFSLFKFLEEISDYASLTNHASTNKLDTIKTI